MSFNFPDSPATDQVYAPSGGPTYQWNGTGWTVLDSGVIDVTAPAVVSFSPADNATGVATGASLVVTFNEDVALGAAGSITLKKTSDNSTIEAWDVATEAGSTAGKVETVGPTLAMHLTSALLLGVGYYVIWDAGVVKDLAGNLVAAQSSTTAWSFTTIDYLDLDLTNPTTAALLTYTQVDGCFAENLDGTWTRFAANTPRITNKGLRIEPSRSNLVRWNRDLTNAQWVKTNMTVAKDQTGIDGVANSASRMTATAANAEITNTCSASAGNKLLAAFVKRLVGTGTVEMSVTGTGNYLPITVTSAWTRVNNPVVNTGNPTLRFRLGTSGDSIAVDLVTMEGNNSEVLTSPIETQGAIVTRLVDLVSVNTAALGLAAGPNATVFAQLIPTSPISSVVQQYLQFDDNTISNRILLSRIATTGVPVAYNQVSGANVGLGATSMGTALADGVRARAAASVATGAQACTKDGGAGATTAGATPQVALNTLWLGAAGATAGNPYWGWFERVTLYRTAKTLAELQAMTTLP